MSDFQIKIRKGPLGIKFINDNFPWWPGGGKDQADSWSNIAGDQVSALVGWWVAKKWL